MVAVLVKYVILLMLSICCQGIHKDIEVKGTGILPIKSGDVGFALYITVKNTGHSQLHVVTKMIECCESLSEDMNDCSFMRLMGGNMGFIAPNVTRNITLLFPNMYPYNRRGDCLIGIWYRDRYNATAEVRSTVEFNTFSELYNRPPISSYKMRRNIRVRCGGIDLDPLDGCRPVDCHQKYNGEKTYFSRIRNQCMVSPACYSDPNKNMPDIAYLPVSNICRDLENPITEEDVRYLTKKSGSKYDSTNKDGEHVKWSEVHMNVRCHHGEMNNKTGLCRCNEGWTSPPVKDNLLFSSTLLFHMCTIKKTYIRLFSFGLLANKLYDHGAKILLVALGMNALAFILLCTCFPSLTVSYLYSDEDDSEEASYHSEEFCDSRCSSTTNDYDDCSSISTMETVDTCFLLLDKPGCSLYTKAINSTIYEEVIEEIVYEFNSESHNRGIQTTFTSQEVSPITDSSESSCSNLIIESDRSSVSEEDPGDSDSSLGSLEPDWEVDDVGQTDLNMREERLLLDDYIARDKQIRRYSNDININNSPFGPLFIEGTCSIFESQARSIMYPENNITTGMMRDKLTRELEETLLGSSHQMNK